MLKGCAPRLSAAVGRCELLEGRILLAADLVISEILASNSNGIVDKFGDHSDWIEIHNRGDEPADLSNYSLTDDPAKDDLWHFPQQSLAAGGYLIVFASDRNLSVANQELHTDFKLSASGEYLGLIGPDNITPVMEFSPFPVQTTDVSYGMASEDTPGSALVYFATPTPGAPNALVTPTPVITAGKLFSGSQTITMTDSDSAASIYYTTNGTLPTASSTRYTAPFSITTNTLIRSRAIDSAMVASTVVSQSFGAMDSTVSSFGSNLPVVVVDTFGKAINDTTFTAAAATFIDTGATGDASVLDAPDFNGRIGIHIRGQSSEMFPKKAFAVETWDENNNDKKVSLLDMPAESDWILYAPYSEKSLMQNALAMQWSNEMGHYASRTRYVEVFLNSDGGSTLNYSSDYQGIYILMEKIKVSDDRVDIAKLTSSDNSDPNITGGYIWKKDKFDSGETGFSTSSGQVLINVEPDATDITAQQKSYLVGYINSFEAALNGPNYKDPVNGYAKYIDVDSFIDSWLLVEMTKNVDGFRFSTYYYKDRGGKIHMEPIWDYNLSLGNADYNTGNSPTGWYHNVLGSADYPYFARLFSDPDFNQKVIDRWQELRRTIFSTSTLMGDINSITNLLADGTTNYPVGKTPAQPSTNALVRNYKKWQVLGTYVWPNGFYDSQGRWIEDVNLMKNFITQRVAWMDSQYVAAPSLAPAGGIQHAPVTVTISGASGLVFYTVDGSDPRLSGGAVSPNAIPYTGPFTVSSTTRVIARNLLVGNWSGTADAIYNFGSPLRITELNYHPANHAGVADPEDLEFIELLNTGMQTINLEGVSITTAVDYTFPAGTTLAAGQRIVIAHNASVFTQVYGAGINLAPGQYSGKLDNAGEQIILLGPLGEEIESFTYDDAAPWPAAADGAGKSLEIIDPLGDPGDPGNWRASYYDGGSPGTNGLADTTPPTVQSAQYDFEHQTVVVQFSENVLASLSGDEAKMEPLADGAAIGSSSFTYSAGTNTATFAFPSTLPDGNYRLRIPAAAVQDTAGNPIAEYTLVDPALFVLAADANRDRKVDETDLGILSLNWGQTGRAFSQGNFDYSPDGKVDVNDLNVLAAHWQQSLAAPVLSPAPPAVQAPVRKAVNRIVEEIGAVSADESSEIAR